VNTSDGNAQGRTGNGGQAPAVKAVDQAEDQGRQHQHDEKGQPHRIPAPQQAGHQHLPHQQNGIHKGEDCPDAGPPGKQHQQQQKQPRQQCLLIQPVVVGHGDHGDDAGAVADGDKGHVAGGKQLVLGQGTVEPVDSFHGLPLEMAAQQLHRAPLLAGADKAGIHDVALVGGQRLCPNTVGILIGKIALKARGQHQQYHQQHQRGQYRAVGLPGKRGKSVFHKAS